MSESESPRRATGRRSRERAREEILGAAEQFLGERPLRDLTVGELMKRTTVGRSAFYVYFRDRYHLVTALLERLEAQLLEAAGPWLTGPGTSDPLADVRSALEGTVAIWAEHGSVLRAIGDGASQDPQVEHAYRWGLLEHFIVAVSGRIEAGQSVGRVGTLDARETAAALILMNERYLADRMGRSPQPPPEEVVDTLYAIWSAVLYGSMPVTARGSQRPGAAGT